MLDDHCSARSRINAAKLPLTVCVSGSRAFGRPDWVVRFTESMRPGTELVHGGCPDSPDTDAGAFWERRIVTWREEHGFRPHHETPPEQPFRHASVFLADWYPTGRANPIDTNAARKRNQRMLAYVKRHGGVLVSFATVDADGIPTSGTADGIWRADALGVPRYVVRLWPDGHADVFHRRFDRFLLADRRR